MVRATIRIAMTVAAVAVAGSASGAVFNITPVNSIQATVNMAVNGDTIVLAAGNYNQVVNLGNKQLTLEGAGIGLTTVSALALNDSVFRGAGIGSASGGLVIRDMTIMHGTTPTDGVGFGYPVDGGGLALASSTVLVERVRFAQNFAHDDGGGFYSEGSLVTVVDCEFSGNSAKGSGGAALCTSGTVSISGTRFDGNEALDGNADADAGWGGALYLVNQSGAFQVTGCAFEHNEGTRGGAVYTASTTGTFSGCTFEQNDATEGFGGAFYSRVAGVITVLDSALLRNHSVQQGGAVYVDDQDFVLRRCTLAGNSAQGAGGALQCVQTGALTVDRCGFFGNRSTVLTGGAISCSRTATITNSVFAANDAVGGAALSMSLGPSTVAHCTFHGNTADSQPIARTNTTAGTITMRNCLATMNTPVNDTVGGTGWTIVYSNIERSDPMAVVAGLGNINETPSFVAPPSAGGDMIWGTMDDDYGDLRLAAGSAGIDAGDSPSVLTITQDFNGDDRNLDDPATANTGVSAWALCVDMGACEFQPPAAPPACPGNANGDMVVDFDDITEVLANWQSMCP